MDTQCNKDKSDIPLGISCLLVALQIRKFSKGKQAAHSCTCEDYRIIYEQTIQLVKQQDMKKLEQLLKELGKRNVE